MKSLWSKIMANKVLVIAIVVVAVIAWRYYSKNVDLEIEDEA